MAPSLMGYGSAAPAALVSSSMEKAKQ